MGKADTTIIWPGFDTIPLEAVKGIIINFLSNSVLQPSVDEMKTDLSHAIYDNAQGIYLNSNDLLSELGEFINPGDIFVTVLSSGDFAIEASYHGAIYIITFDINPNQYFPASLKFAGLQNYNYQDFWNFFCDPHSKEYLSKTLLERLKASATPNPVLYEFFEHLISKKDEQMHFIRSVLSQMTYGKQMLSKSDAAIATGLNNLRDKARAQLPNDPLYSYVLDVQRRKKSPLGQGISNVFDHIRGYEGLKEKGTYLENEAAFNSAKRKIANSKTVFIHTDLANIKDKLVSAGITEKVHAIYLSNIPSYINGDVFYRIVVEQLMPLLKDGGRIVYCCQGISERKLTKPGIEIVTTPSQNAIFLKNSRDAYELLSKDFGMKQVEKPVNHEATHAENIDTFVHVLKPLKK